MTTNVFNANKTLVEYTTKQPLFFGPKPGLFDTVNKQYPEIWAKYKEMKSLDWDEAEFDYTACNADFKACPPTTAEFMRYTLGWQWEGDSAASRALAPVLAPFISDSSLWAAWQRISDNEVVHAATYSEIVRMSFDNPEEVLQSVLETKESLERLGPIGEALEELYQASHKYALGQITADEAYEPLFMGIVAILLLERIQFMASFAITFTICSSGLFQAIGKAVQKIAQDELEVHVELDKIVLREMMNTPAGKACFEKNQARIKAFIDLVVQREIDWTAFMFRDGRSLLGTNEHTVVQWVLFNAKDVYKFFGIESEHRFPAKNPMLHLEDWLNISSVQAAPQEQDNNQYKVNVVVRDDESTNFEVDF